MIWHSFAIGEVAQVNPKLAAGDRPDPNEEVSFVPMAAVSEETMSIAVHTERPYYEVSKGYTPFKRGDVLVAKITPCFENGKMAIAEDLPHELGFGTTEFHVFRPSERVTGRYLFNLLRVPCLRTAGALKMRGAAGQRRVPADFLSSIEIPLPPLPEQKRIARILDAVDALRAKRREALAQLDTLLQSTFLDMFGDPVTNPMGWQERSLGNLAQSGFRNGLSPSTKGTFDGEVLTLSAITRGRFDFAARKSAHFDKQPPPSQMVRTDTFLICRGNGNKQLVGAGAYPDRSSPRVCFPDTMISVVVDSDAIRSAYLENVWRSWRVRSQIERGARTTNGTHKINQRLISSVVFPVPPRDRQLRFSRIAESVEEQAASQRAHLAELDTLFASLQSRAFRGDL